MLVIADIGGYTKFMKVHRVNLAHAQTIIASLLEAVIDGAEPKLKLAKLEGDAAFFYAKIPDKQTDKDALAQFASIVTKIRMHFLDRQAEFESDRLCNCDSCVQAAQLTLKFVAHVGEVATQTIKQRRKLVGIDVILVHRLLKNPVEAPEYVLFTEELYRTDKAALPDAVHEVSQEVEGIGSVRAYFIEIEDLAGSLPPLPDPSWLGRVGRTLEVAGRGMPYMLGLSHRRRTASAY